MRKTWLVAGTVVALLASASPASATFPGGNARIAMQGANRIDTINASGGDRKTLVGPAMSGIFFSTPAWSPDGTKVAFSSNKDGSDSDIYVISAASGAITPLTTNGAEDDNPVWSPDGTKIAFQSTRDDVAAGRYQLYVMSADGAGQTNLSANVFDDQYPSWSPDGTRIAFARAGNIWVTSSAGGQGTQLTTDPADEAEPDWSPDSSRIVFQRGPSGSTAVVVMSATGANQTPLPLPSGSNSPVWSPDGTKIAFELNLEINSANANGTARAPLTTNGGAAFVADQPRLAAASRRRHRPVADRRRRRRTSTRTATASHRPTDCNDADPHDPPGGARQAGRQDRPGLQRARRAASALLNARHRGVQRDLPDGRYTKFTSMTVKPARKGDRIRLSCKGAGCNAGKKSIRVKKNAQQAVDAQAPQGLEAAQGRGRCSCGSRGPATIGRVRHLDGPGAEDRRRSLAALRPARREEAQPLPAG